MKVVFYSDHCEYSNKLLAYLDKHNIRSLFKLICIDNIEPPKEIDIVPTIIDDMLNQPLKGKKAFEYLVNLKYFNNPTNNIELVKELPSNPEITVEKNIATTFHEENKTENALKSTQQMVNLRAGQDKMFTLLMKMRR